MYPSPGRPWIEDCQTIDEVLHAYIMEIAIHGAADEKRSTPCIRAIRTLDDLHKELLRRGFALSRSVIFTF